MRLTCPSRFPDPKRTRPFSGTPEEIAVQLHALSDVGVEHMACIVDDGQTPGPLTQYPTMSADWVRALSPGSGGAAPAGGVGVASRIVAGQTVTAKNRFGMLTEWASPTSVGNAAWAAPN